MGILHRIYVQHAREVWQVETKLLHALGRVRRPLAVQWLVTAACDLHCPHCYSEAGKRVTGELSTDEAKRLVIDELVALGCQNLVLAGGELWLRRDIPELIAYAAERGLAWSMHTHGAHVAKHRALLEKYPPVLAAISLDDVGAAHDAFRGKVGAFASALDAIAVLKEAGCPEVVAGTTVTRANADRLAPLFPIVAASGADAWGLHLFAPEGRGHEHLELVPSPEQLRRVAAFARTKRRLFHVELCNEWGSAGMDDLLYRDQPFLCGAGRVSCVVSASGEIMPCTTTDLRESEGNVREQPLREVWARGFARFRKPRSGAKRPRPPTPLLWPRAKGTPRPEPRPDPVAGSEEGIDEQECWLQSRNGVSCSRDAFGEGILPTPSLAIDRLLASPALTALRAPGLPRVVSRRAARVVRMAAMSAVFLEGCANKLTSSPAPAQTEAPPPPRESSTVEGSATSTPAGVSRTPLPPPTPLPFPEKLAMGLSAHFGLAGPRTQWKPLLRLLLDPQAPSKLAEGRALAVRLGGQEGKAPGSLAETLDAHLARREKHEPETPASLLALLDAAEAHPIYDTAFVAYLWQQAGELSASSSLAPLFRRLDEHLRIVRALEKAEIATGRPELSPWRSKAAPPPDATERVLIPPGFLAAARAALPTASADDWERRPGLVLSVESGEVELIRPGGVQRFGPDAAFAFRRLDLLRCEPACTLRHPAVSSLALPAGSEISLGGLEPFLGEDGRRAMASRVEKASAGDQRALTALTPLVALAHRAIVSRLAAQPNDPGAPALQMLLARFDE